MSQQGRKVGSKVKLSPLGKRTYPQFIGRVGTITKREILTRGHGLVPGAHHSYRISYFVRFEGERRGYFLGSEHLVKA